MKIRGFLAMTALIAASMATGATAQTTKPRATARKSPAATRPGGPSSILDRGKSRTGSASSSGTSRQPTGRPARRAPALIDPNWLDPTGRIDYAGRSVAFYPSVRGQPGTRKQASAFGARRR